MSSPHKLSLHNLYNCHCPDCGGIIERLSISDSENEDLLKAFNKAARHIFRKKKTEVTASDIDHPAVQPLLNNINSVLQDGFNKGIAHEVTYILRRDLQENVHVFSGAKTFAELKELSGRLLDADGNIKPFNKFWQEVQAVHADYNKSYLESEYIFATQSAQMASKWNEFATDGDRYNLQYRTAGDDRVRASHAVLQDTTLPPSDPFWDKYFPPNGWRCRCTTVQVRKGKYPESNSTSAQIAGSGATQGTDEIFRFNPGKQSVIFPENHPYLKELSADERKAIDSSAAKSEQWATVPTKQGTVSVSSLHGKTEVEENLTISSHLANEFGYDIQLIARSDVKKTADSYNRTLGVFQEYKMNNVPTRSAIDNAIRSGAKQANDLVLYINSDIRERDLINAVQNRVRRTGNVEYITIIRGNKISRFSRNEVISPEWTF